MKPSPAPLRVLVVGHAHPALSVGGGELAAYRLFLALRQQPEVRAWFLACGGAHVSAVEEASFRPLLGDDEFVYRADEYDHFFHANRTPGFAAAWQALLQRLRPDVIHLHHFLNLGAEALLVARRSLPHVRLVLTLHDLSAPCHHFGQMVTRPARALCLEATPTACHRCFPDRPADDFFLRARVLRRFLALADHFIAPSRFVAERHVAWGLPPARMAVIENIIPPAPPTATLAARTALAASAGGPLRCGYFGQLTPFKGIRLLLDAVRLLAPRGAPPVHVEIHGDAANQDATGQAELRALLADPPANVSLHGAYPNARVDALMRGVDVVVVPSLWWENAPNVIEEALRAGRPVICADIGGMAEKVRDGIDGLHFLAGSAPSLADAIEALSRDRALLARLAAGLRRPAAPQDVVGRHLALYNSVAEAAEAP